ncbi:MAG: hypothetical protein AAF705_04820 [Bacteroidota bacterium]
MDAIQNCTHTLYFKKDAIAKNRNMFLIGDRHHHLLLCLQIFKSELDYAREHGSEKLFELLKERGIYPYGDLDRTPIA